MNRNALIGLVGSALLVLVIVPEAGTYISMAGLALVTAALITLSREVGDGSITRYSVASFVLAFIAFAILEWGVDTALSLAKSSVTIPTPTITGLLTEPLGIAMHIIMLVVPFLATAYVAIVLSTYFIRRAYTGLAEATGVERFRKAGNWYLIAGATLIIAIGLVLFIVADVIAALAYKDLT